MVSRAGVPIVLRNVSKAFGADGDRPFPALGQISVSIAPVDSSRSLPDQRVRDLAPALTAAAGELSALWPLRLQGARRLGPAGRSGTARPIITFKAFS
jgi:hypothetical protein